MPTTWTPPARLLTLPSKTAYWVGFAYVEENLSMVAHGLRRTAELYETADNSNAEQINSVAADLW